MNQKQKEAIEAVKQIDNILAAFAADQAKDTENEHSSNINLEAISDSFTAFVVDPLSRLAMLLEIDTQRMEAQERDEEVGEDTAHELIARLAIVANEVRSIYESAESMTGIVRALAC